MATLELNFLEITCYVIFLINLPDYRFSALTKKGLKMISETTYFEYFCLAIVLLSILGIFICYTVKTCIKEPSVFKYSLAKVLDSGANISK